AAAEGAAAVLSAIGVQPACGLRTLGQTQAILTAAIFWACAVRAACVADDRGSARDTAAYAGTELLLVAAVAIVLVRRRGRAVRIGVDADLFAALGCSPTPRAAQPSEVPRPAHHAGHRAAAMTKRQPAHLDALPLCVVRHARGPLHATRRAALDRAAIGCAVFAYACSPAQPAAIALDRHGPARQRSRDAPRSLSAETRARLAEIAAQLSRRL